MRREARGCARHGDTLRGSGSAKAADAMRGRRSSPRLHLLRPSSRSDFMPCPHLHSDRRQPALRTFMPSSCTARVDPWAPSSGGRRRAESLHSASAVFMGEGGAETAAPRRELGQFSRRPEQIPHLHRDRVRRGVGRRAASTHASPAARTAQTFMRARKRPASSPLLEVRSARRGPLPSLDGMIASGVRDVCARRCTLQEATDTPKDAGIGTLARSTRRSNDEAYSPFNRQLRAAVTA